MQQTVNLSAMRLRRFESSPPHQPPLAKSAEAVRQSLKGDGGPDRELRLASQHGARRAQVDDSRAAAGMPAREANGATVRAGQVDEGWWAVG